MATLINSNIRKTIQILEKHFQNIEVKGKLSGSIFASALSR
jgi:hypothetical protein